MDYTNFRTTQYQPYEQEPQQNTGLYDAIETVEGEQNHTKAAESTHLFEQMIL